jgi:hypothetical protein
MTAAANETRNNSNLRRIEMQTAFSITGVTFSANHLAPGLIGLSVNFQIFNNGPSHVAGLVVTTDFWGTSQIAPAAFQGFGAGFEFWRANFSVSGVSSATFEFVIFCDDFGGEDFVPRIWNTNGGNRFQARV